MGIIPVFDARGTEPAGGIAIVEFDRRHDFAVLEQSLAPRTALVGSNRGKHCCLNVCHASFPVI